MVDTRKGGNPLENYEARAEKTQEAISKQQTETVEAFKQTESAVALLEVLGDLESIENPDAVFERIVTLYSKNKGDLKEAIKATFSPPHSTQLGIPEISEEEKGELITSIMSFIDENSISTATIPKKGEEEEENKKWEGEKGDEELKENDNHTEEHPFYPTLLRLKNEGNIKISELDDIIKDIEKNGASNEAFLSGIKSSIKDSGKQEELLSLFKEVPPEEAKKNFFKDAKVPEKEQENNITILIGENYKKIPNKEGESNTQADIKLAIQTATNKTIHGKQDINRDDSTFKDAIKVIQDGGNTESMYRALETIYTFVNTGEGKKEKPKKGKGENVSLENPGRQAMMEKINTIIDEAKIAGDNKKILRAEKVSQKLAQEKVDEGEGGMGGGEELDTLIANLDTLSSRASV